MGAAEGVRTQALPAMPQGRADQAAEGVVMDEPQEAADALQWWVQVGAREEYEAWLDMLEIQRRQEIDKEQS